MIKRGLTIEGLAITLFGMGGVVGVGLFTCYLSGEIDTLNPITVVLAGTLILLSSCLSAYLIFSNPYGKQLPAIFFDDE